MLTLRGLGPDCFERKPYAQAFRYFYAAVFLHIVFQNGGEHAGDGKSRAIQGVHRLGFPVRPAIANVRPASLKIRKITATGNLQPSLLPRSPYFQVKLLGMRKTYVSGANQEYPVGKPELLE